MYQKCDAFAEVLFNNIKHIISLMLTVMSAIFVAKTSFNTVEKGVSVMLLIFWNSSYPCHWTCQMSIFLFSSEQEHDLVALIPVRDRRLKPRRTWVNYLPLKKYLSSYSVELNMVVIISPDKAKPNNNRKIQSWTINVANISNILISSFWTNVRNLWNIKTKYSENLEGFIACGSCGKLAISSVHLLVIIVRYIKFK